MTNSCIFENLLWSKTLAVTFPARCRKYFSCLKLHSKLIGLELLIIIIPFEKPKIEVQIFDRTSLSGFAMKEFTTKEGFNTKNQALLLIKLRSCFKLWSSYKDICCIKVKCSLFLNYSFSSPDCYIGFILHLLQLVCGIQCMAQFYRCTSRAHSRQRFKPL